MAPQSYSKKDVSNTLRVFKHIGNAMRQRDDTPIEHREIDHIQFDFMSEEEIKHWSVVEITSKNFSGNNSLGDPRMGPTNLSELCATCGQTSKVCPGHCGRIVLPRKVPHPMRLKLITQYLSLFCYNCHRLVVLEEKMVLLNIHQKNR